LRASWSSKNTVNGAKHIPCIKKAKNKNTPKGVFLF